MPEFWDEVPAASGSRLALDPEDPMLDGPVAFELAKLLEAGMGEAAAVEAVVPGIRPEVRDRLVRSWFRDPQVLEAVRLLHGGTWGALTPDQRIGVALAKHRAQLARYLLETDFATAKGAEAAKLSEARAALEKFTAGEIDPTDPLAAFARTAKTIMEQAAQAPRPAPVTDLEGDTAIDEAWH